MRTGFAGSRRLLLWRWAALFFLGGPGALSAAETIVSLTFDDNTAGHALAARILSERGLKGTFYVNSGRIGSASSYLSRDDLRVMASDGHEIAGHTVSHANLTELPAGEVRRQVCEDRERLQEWGFEPVSFAYPFGAFNDIAQQAVRDCGYTNARAVGGLSCASCARAETLPPATPYAARTPESIKSDMTLDDVQRMVTDAENAGGGWVPLVFHLVCDDCGSLAVSPSVLADFADWLRERASRGTVVRTVAEALETAPEGPPNPVSSIAAVSPNSVMVGSGGFLLSVSGEGFIPGSVVSWNGSDRATVFISSGSLTAAIPDSDVAQAGEFPIRVFNPAPGGGISNSVRLKVEPPLAVDPSFSFRDLYVFPNPALDGAQPTIVLAAGVADRVEIRIFDGAGREVHAATLEREPAVIRDGSGPRYAYEYPWSGGIASGVYLYTIQAVKEGHSPIQKTGRFAVVR
jgi:peptidoglycan/xylan/chitin deacetylase (PgdA/CDA1 family)